MRLSVILLFLQLWVNVDVTLSQSEIICDKLHIDNADIIGTERWAYKYNNQVEYACRDGYEGRFTITCASHGWHGVQSCREITCNKLDIDNADITSTEKWAYKYNNQVEYACRDGYEGRFTITCTANGWHGVQSCREKTCTTPPGHDLIDNFRENDWNRRLGATKSYTCKTGYKNKDGKDRATCTADGWKPNPLCEEITCDKLHIDNADIIGTERWAYKLNNRVQYACRDGYEGRFTITCTSHGWHGVQSCREIRCNKLDIDNADIIGTERWAYKYNNQVEYACRDGYEGRFTITCTANGWHGVQDCREKTCTRPPGHDLIDNFRENDWNRRLGARKSYTCKTGYKNKDGKDRATCTVDGWKPNPLCEDGTACSKPQVENGFAVGPHDGIFYYTCNEGYKLSNNGWWSEVKCVDGVLSEPLRCIDKGNCGETPEIPHAVIAKPSSDEYIEGQITTILCEEGYNSTFDQMTCLKGQWDLNGMSLKTVCTPLGKPCNPPPKVENAIVMSSYQRKYISETEVTYQCRDKYAMEGEDRITCKDGEWENKNIKCIHTY